MIADRDGCIRHSVRRMKQLFGSGRKLDQHIGGLLALVRHGLSEFIKRSLWIDNRSDKFWLIEGGDANAEPIGDTISLKIIVDG